MASPDVKLRHKVQLRKKVEEPKESVETEGAVIDNTPDKYYSKIWLWITRNAWLCILIGVIVVCAIGYFIYLKSGDSTITESEQETEIVEKTIVTTDSVANQEATEKVLPTDDNEVSNIANEQEAKENEALVITNNNSNIATTTTSSASNANVSNDVEAEAMKVIRGDYGVGQERKDKLGNQYHPIQNRVNQLKREGVF